MEKIAHPENLREAFLRSVRGKAGKREVQEFRIHLDESLMLIREKLLTGNYPFGSYRFFTIHDPKKRLICAAPFADRVTFHAMMRICHPVFDNYQIYDSYASRIDKGVYKALERAQSFVRRYAYFAKLDVCHFFDSIDHDVVMQQLTRLFKDKVLLNHFDNLLKSYHTSQGKGLPIGNLTSQYFANHYLSVADHYVKETLHVPAMVRYMDDMLLFADDLVQLSTWVNALQQFVTSHLLLQFHMPVINRTSLGVPFLGYVVYSNRLRLNQRSRKRYLRKTEYLARDFEKGKMKEDEFVRHMEALTAFVNKADSRAFRYKVFNRAGMTSIEQALIV